MSDPDQVAPEAATGAGWRRWLGWLWRPRPLAELPSIIGLFAIIGTVFGWLGSWHWRLELFSHFRWQYFLALAVCGGVIAVLPRRHRPPWWRHAAMVGFAVANFAAVLPAWLPRTVTPAADGPRLRVLTLNVHVLNSRYQDVTRAILAADADVVLLMEVNTACLAGMAELAARYPYRLAAPQADSFGMVLYSRRPLAGMVKSSLVGALPYVDVHIPLGEGEIRLLGIHTLPPVSRDYATGRNAQLREAATLVGEERIATVLAGDLNCTPWSPPFRRLLAATGLRDSRRGFGLQASWPTFFPAPCRIPIDHVLHSPDLAVVSRKLGPVVGSDHRPVICELAPAAAPAR